MDLVLTGQKEITARHWPSFLYDQSMYDSCVMEAGLLRGLTLFGYVSYLFSSLLRVNYDCPDVPPPYNWP